MKTTSTPTSNKAAASRQIRRRGEKSAVTWAGSGCQALSRRATMGSSVVGAADLAPTASGCCEPRNRSHSPKRVVKQYLAWRLSSAVAGRFPAKQRCPGSGTV
jgi:hypothetical protein